MALAIREDLIRDYNLRMSQMEILASQNKLGSVRAEKGKLLESLAENIVRLAWREAGGSVKRLSIGNIKTFPVNIRPDYVDELPPTIKRYVRKREDSYFYKAKVDRHVFIDDRLTIGIECKSYTENAMLKRILVDFRLLKSLYPDMVCCLLQLESQLGGEYYRPLANPQFGSKPTHTLMSFFSEVEIDVVTLLGGERKVDQPIHKPKFRKELKFEVLDHAINRFSTLLRPFL